MVEEIKKENRMGTDPINKLLISISLPMVISMLVQAMYNVVDSIFVSRVSENALTAVSMAFPLQTMIFAIGIGTGVGVNAVLSKSLGEKNYEMVSLTAKNGIFLSFASFILFLVVGLTCVKPFYLGQTDNAEIVKYGVDYLSIVTVASLGVFLQIMLERLLISTGKTFYSMITQTVGAITNIILDPILIFGLFGLPKMGTAGAAIATVVGQTLAAVLALIFNIKVNHEVKLFPVSFKPDFKVIGMIYKIGVPSIIMQSIGSVMVYIMNRVLMGFSSTAVAVFGVYFKLQSFIFMPVFGLNNGMVPIVAYNYGAGNKDRIMKTWKLAWIYSFIIMLIGTLLFELIPGQLLGFFDASEQMLIIGIPSLRIIGTHFMIASFAIVTISVFQALGYSIYSLITSVMRQVVVLIPAAILLSRLGNVNYVWLAFPIAEIMSLITTAFFFRRLYKRVIVNI